MTTDGADALDPVRAELLRAAHQEADDVLAEARWVAAEVRHSARREADTVLAQARSQGEAEGAAAGATVLTRARRTARSLELAARYDACQELRRRIADRVGELYRDRPELWEQLEARSRALLGPEAVVAEHPDGGVLARTPGRRVDFGLPELAERAFDRLGAEAEALWAQDPEPSAGAAP